MHPSSAIGGANHVQGPGPLPESSSISAVAEQTKTEQSEPASRPGNNEEEKVGNSPTSSFRRSWTDPTVTCSLQQTIADQPASPLAQPFALGDGDPANQRPSEAAHQSATSARTGTKSPAAPFTTPALPVDNIVVAVVASKQKPTAQYSMKSFLLWLLQDRALLLRLAVGLLQDRLRLRLLQTGAAVGPPHLPGGNAAVAPARVMGAKAGTLRSKWSLPAQSSLT